MLFVTSKILAVGKSLLLLPIHDLKTYFSIKVLFFKSYAQQIHISGLEKGFCRTEPETEVGGVGSTEVEYLCPQDGPHTTRLCETIKSGYCWKCDLATASVQ